LGGAMSSAAKPAAEKPKAVAGGGLDIKALLAKTQGGASKGPSAGAEKLVTITQKLDFCGEEIVVTKKVKAGSKEEIEYKQGLSTGQPSPSSAAGKSSLQEAVAVSTQLQKQMAASSATQPALAGAASGLEFKAALPPPKLKPVATGLQGLLASIDGKKKMSTMEKSKHDWQGFKEKQDETTRSEMEKFAKDGYLEKQAFLLRTDARQADVARTNRRRGMGIKD